MDGQLCETAKLHMSSSHQVLSPRSKPHKEMPPPLPRPKHPKPQMPLTFQGTSTPWTAHHLGRLLQYARSVPQPSTPTEKLGPTPPSCCCGGVVHSPLSMLLRSLAMLALLALLVTSKGE
jgi:hypothetical protein